MAGTHMGLMYHREYTHVYDKVSSVIVEVCMLLGQLDSLLE